MIVETKEDIVSEDAKAAYPDTGLYPEAIVALARDAFDKGFAAARAASLPDRSATVKVIAKCLSDYNAVAYGPGWDAEALRHKTGMYFKDLDDDTAEGIADLVLAALSPHPAAGEVEWGVRNFGGSILPMPPGEEYARRYVAIGTGGRTLMFRTVSPWIEAQS